MMIKKFFSAVLCLLFLAPQVLAFQSELTFYRDPAVALLGTTPSTPWKMAGRALSASSVRIYPGTRHVKEAEWILVWAPNALGTYNSVRLVTADDGPINLQQIANIGRNAGASPVVDSFDITSAVNAIIDGGVSKQILMQTAGDASSAIYRSTIDLVWED